MNQMKERILTCASRLFLKNGVRAITMNDVAAALGISKRTLYDYVENKDDLLGQSIVFQYNTDAEKYDEIEAEARNPVDLVYRHFRHAVIRISDIHPNFMNELQRSFPAVWNERVVPLLKERETITRKLVSDGIEQGYFRSDINPDIAAKMLFAQVDMMSDTDTFPPERYPRAYLFRHILTGFLRGLATEKGLREIETLFYNRTQEEHV